MFLIWQMKRWQQELKLQLDLNIELTRAVLSTNFNNREGEGSHLTTYAIPYSKTQGRNHLILSCIVWKKLNINVEKPSNLRSHINSNLDKLHQSTRALRLSFSPSLTIRHEGVPPRIISSENFKNQTKFFFSFVLNFIKFHLLL